MAAALQYVIRQAGDFNYQYADDLMWDVGPAYYLVLKPKYSLAVRANVSGEYKKRDSMDGVLQEDTSIRAIFGGPEIIVTAEKWTGELGFDFPIDINNGGVQAVADHRIRAAISYRF